MADPTLVYIAGYGRSGSSLLERILGSNAKIWATGELVMFLELLDDAQTLCSCGQPVRSCPFWATIITKMNDDNREQWKRVQRRVESIFGVCELCKRGGLVGIYQKFARILFTAIFEGLPPGVEYLVDSSKTARKCRLRPLALVKYGGVRVKLIHLVRDGRGCMWSNLKGSNRRMEKRLNPHIPFAALRTAISWPLANLAAHLFQLLQPSDYCRIRYEDFIEDPAVTLSKLGKFLGVNFDRQVEGCGMEEEAEIVSQAPFLAF